MDYNPIIHRIKTPVEMLNIVGVGGLHLNTIVECWGNPQSGKSTFSYQTGGMYLEQFGDDAELLILDAESSIDISRLRHAYNIRPCNIKGVRNPDSRVSVQPGFTLESGETEILKKVKEIKKDNRSLLVIWDSISATMPKTEFEDILKAMENEDESNPYAGGMMLKARVLKRTLNSLMLNTWQLPVTIILINQATTSIGRYHSKETSGGGYGLKHNRHYGIRFNFQKKFGEDGYFAEGTLTHLTLEKSKFSPNLFDIPVYIRDNLGGVIDPIEEIITVAFNMGIIVQRGGWYRLGEEAMKRFNDDETVKEYFPCRWAKLKTILGLPTFIRAQIETLFRSNYKLVDFAYQDRDEELKLIQGEETDDTS